MHKVTPVLAENGVSPLRNRSIMAVFACQISEPLFYRFWPARRGPEKPKKGQNIATMRPGRSGGPRCEKARASGYVLCRLRLRGKSRWGPPLKDSLCSSQKRLGLSRSDGRFHPPSDLAFLLARSAGGSLGNHSGAAEKRKRALAKFRGSGVQGFRGSGVQDCC